ncbi:hypothetical protein IGI04_027518 [Brassica rapa subsp. trilocularis]|uniref:Thioredoxin domain-containing protein n=1 Tax=Brassica rapa subsp. trilocularis TaxID=1813537 RepID=A0ABQ7L1M3_BRACM|nr:hypothetical protein IGI04_027518 [Brassica rapa subsp. trilocularis]
MEALVCRKLGDPTATETGSPESPVEVSKNHPIPPLTSDTAVRVKVTATSLNFANYLQILGKYQEKPPLPFIPGSDYSGIVDAIGPAVTKFRVGDRVCSFAALGSYAQFIVADQSLLFLVPEGCDMIAAAALPVAFGTSHVALVHRARLTSGQVLMVLGAAGGVGLAAVQIGKICGAVVIAVARGSEKIQLLKSMGVDHVVDLGSENVITSVKEFVKTRKLKGVDVLYDPVGGKLTKESMKVLNWGAQILVIGFASGEVPLIPANIALVKNWTVHGLYWGSYKIHQPNVLDDSIRELLSWLARGLITMHISHTYSLSQANLAFGAIKDRKVIGKVMIALDHKATLNLLFSLQYVTYFGLREDKGSVFPLWSCICCSSNKDEAQARSQHGPKGKVHPVTKIEKWEEKITEANNNGMILVVYFSAPWCVPCKKIEPVFKKLASIYPSMIFVTIDVEELAEFSDEWNVEATPTIVFLKDGRQMDKLVGAETSELQKKTAAAADLLLKKP